MVVFLVSFFKQRHLCSQDPLQGPVGRWVLWMFTQLGDLGSNPTSTTHWPWLCPPPPPSGYLSEHLLPHPRTRSATSLRAERALQASMGLGGILDPPILAFWTQRSYPNPKFPVHKIQMMIPFFIALLREIKAITSRVAKYLIWISLSGIWALPWGWGVGKMFEFGIYGYIYFSDECYSYPVMSRFCCNYSGLLSRLCLTVLICKFDVKCVIWFLLNFGVQSRRALCSEAQLGTSSRQVAIRK